MKQSKAKPERDAKLMAFLAANPGWGSQTKAAKRFRLSRERVSQIVKRAKRNGHA